MKCEMYWGGIPCESENTILFNVKLASGGNKKIYMCPKCHYKYFGKRQSRPTPRRADSLKAGRKLPAKKSNRKGSAPA